MLTDFGAPFPDDQRTLVTLRRFILAGDQFAVKFIEENADPEQLKAALLHKAGIEGLLRRVG